MERSERDEALDDLAVALRDRLLGEAGRAGAAQGDCTSAFPRSSTARRPA
jgi:hypothetical protein